MEKEINILKITTAAQWRDWLAKNHHTTKPVWLKMQRKNSTKPGLLYEDAIDEALCYGWIDSTKRAWDENFSIQSFTPRKPKSVWSKLNKTRVEQLIAAGLMTPSGQAKIDLAKKNGQWTHLDAVESLTLPADFAKALRAAPAGARKHYDSLSPSARKILLYQIHNVKRPENRAKKIAAAVECCATRQQPSAFRPLR